MQKFVDKWLKEYPDPYPQRYRKNIPFNWVKKNGTLLMTLTDGESHIQSWHPQLLTADSESHSASSRFGNFPFWNSPAQCPSSRVRNAH